MDRPNKKIVCLHCGYAHIDPDIDLSPKEQMRQCRMQDIADMDAERSVFEMNYADFDTPDYYG